MANEKSNKSAKSWNLTGAGALKIGANSSPNVADDLKNKLIVSPDDSSSLSENNNTTEKAIVAQNSEAPQASKTLDDQVKSKDSNTSSQEIREEKSGIDTPPRSANAVRAIKKGEKYSYKGITNSSGESHKSTVLIDFDVYHDFAASLKKDKTRKITVTGFYEAMAVAVLEGVIDLDKVLIDLHKKGLIELEKNEK
ncbi:TPA: hypothetical protein ACGIK9_002943 [Acinetobacter baumannii]|uniref:hypothetical protein n=1 Tax=Acinetobacter baumannii TaxID=470 RepID=UPI00338D4F3B